VILLETTPEATTDPDEVGLSDKGEERRKKLEVKKSTSSYIFSDIVGIERLKDIVEIW